MAKKKSPEIRIEPLENKGFLVHHSQDTGSGPYKAPKKYAFSNHADMLAHVAKATKAPKPKTFKDAMMSMKDKQSAQEQD